MGAAWERDVTCESAFIFLLQQHMVLPCPQSVESSTQSHIKFGYIPYCMVSYFLLKLCTHISTLPYMYFEIYFLHFITLKYFLNVTVHFGFST